MPANLSTDTDTELASFSLTLSPNGGRDAPGGRRERSATDHWPTPADTRTLLDRR